MTTFPLLVHAVLLCAQPMVDHHVHVMSQGLVRDWQSLGVPFSRPDAAYTGVSGLMVGADLRAVLVPMGHLYLREGFRDALRLSLDSARARARRENDWVAAEAARYPGRTVALCSIHPLDEVMGLAEAARCDGLLAVRGLKVHVASAGLDLRRAAHLDALARVAARAEAAGQVLLIHLDPQVRGHDVGDIRTFADRVLGPHPRLRVVIAHLGGSGGYGGWTQSVFRTLTDWLRSHAEHQVYFDLSAVVLEEESEGVPATTDAEARALAADLRDLGLERIVFGSDYPVFDPRTGARALGERVGLTASELDAIVQRAVPGLFGAPTPR